MMMIYEMDDETYNYNLDNLKYNLLDHLANNQLNFITAESIWKLELDKTYIKQTDKELVLIKKEKDVGYYTEIKEILEYFRYFFHSDTYNKELFISWATTKHMSIEISETVFRSILIQFFEYIQHKQSQGIIKSIPLSL